MPTKPAKPKRETLSVEVVPPAKCPTLDICEAAEIGAQIRAEHDLIHKSARLTAFIAIRIGLRLLWVRDNGKHGDLGKFMKEHLPGVPRSSCYNYINAANDFAEHANLKDKKAHKLTDGQKIEPLVTIDVGQLELTDGKAVKSLEKPVRAMIDYVGERSLTDIYRGLSHEEPEETNLKGGARKKSKRDELQERIDAAIADRVSIFEQQQRGDWKCLDEKELGLLINELSEFLKAIGEHQKEVRKAKPGAWKGAEA